MRICALIPSYNEAKTISGIIKELKMRGTPVYVVDDGSSDGTAAMAESQDAIVIRHKTNMGKGAALRDGFARVLKDGFEAVLVMDGDGQHHIDDIDMFLRKMEEENSDMVIGNRMFDTGSMPLSRILTNHFMSNLISRISGKYVPDTQCGFRLIKRGLLRQMRLESGNYEIESEMVLEAAKKSFKIDSVPIKTIYQDEKSRINPILDTLRFITLLIRLSFKR